MKKYIVVDSWNGDSDPIGTISEAVAEAENRIAKLKWSRREYDRYKKDFENFMYIAETKKIGDHGAIVASVEITPENLGRFY